jgi:hypothetical protein
MFLLWLLVHVLTALDVVQVAYVVLARPGTGEEGPERGIDQPADTVYEPLLNKDRFHG